jgi:V/A-type H+-transporting ATPase subunit E
MTGLEKILKAIDADAKTAAEAVIAQAKREADDIISAAKAEADKKCAGITLKSEMELKAVLSRTVSAAELTEKKIILDAKQQIINNIIKNARISLANLPDAEYVNVLIRMVNKYAHKNAGKIIFSASDKKRLPKDFEAQLRKVLSDREGASLTISEDTVDLDGGFLLIYGEVEENCSFDALFTAAKEELQDIINSFLFTGVSQKIHPIGE